MLRRLPQVNRLPEKRSTGEQSNAYTAAEKPYFKATKLDEVVLGPEIQRVFVFLPKTSLEQTISLYVCMSARGGERCWCRDFARCSRLDPPVLFGKQRYTVMRIDQT